MHGPDEPRRHHAHIQTATKIIADYIVSEDKMIAKGNFPTVNQLYAFLDRMAETFHDAHKDVMKRIGIKELLKEESSTKRSLTNP